MDGVWMVYGWCIDRAWIVHEESMDAAWWKGGNYPLAPLVDPVPLPLSSPKLNITNIPIS
jgi:hypothetical protein